MAPGGRLSPECFSFETELKIAGRRSEKPPAKVVKTPSQARTALPGSR